VEDLLKNTPQAALETVKIWGKAFQHIL
jgi:hypothetical protein